MIVRRSISEPFRSGMSQQELWRSSDKGLILCWEIGRKRAEEKPELAAMCKNGELPVLGWKGGVSRQLLKLDKFGSLMYLAQWQGLRGEDLEVNLEDERKLICTKTQMAVTFTPDQTKYSSQI